MNDGLREEAIKMCGKHILLPPHLRDGKPVCSDEYYLGHTAAKGVMELKIPRLFDPRS
jgi:hypothetical protein